MGVIKLISMHKKSSYHTWTSLRNRCMCVTNYEYHNYGGRGIKVCKRWDKFSNFYDDMGDKPIGKTLERIDNNGDYCPENCRWATTLEQNNNQRKTRFIEHGGERLSVSAWARKLGIHRSTLFSRIRLGFPPEMVLAAEANYRFGNVSILTTLGRRKRK